MSRTMGVHGSNNDMFVAAGNSITRHNANQQANKTRKSTVFARDLNMSQDSILARKKKAQRDAMKILNDVFESDMKTDAEQKKRLQNIEEMTQENKALKDKLKDINTMQKDLMEECGITEDSQEYKDLELLRKVNNKKRSICEVEAY